MLKDKLLAWIGGGASLALAAALAFIWITKAAEIGSLQRSTERLTNRVELLSSDLTQCRPNGRSLEQAISSQSAAVAALAAAGEQRAIRLASSMDRAAIASGEARSAAERILREVAGDDVCTAADRLIIREAGQ